MEDDAKIGRQAVWSMRRAIHRAKQASCIELAVRRAGNGGIDQENIESSDTAHRIECTVGRSIGGIGKRFAYKYPAVVIAGDCHEWHL
jgi:hypothetical protein